MKTQNRKNLKFNLHKIKWRIEFQIFLLFSAGFGYIRPQNCLNYIFFVKITKKHSTLRYVNAILIQLFKALK